MVVLFHPTACQSCSAVQLVASEECVDGAASCRSCGAVAHAIAGPAYPERDLYLFYALSSAVESASMSPLEALELAQSLAAAGSAANFRDALDTAVRWLPDLAALGPILVTSPDRARQALSILDTVLRERAKPQAKRSGFAPRQVRCG